MTRKQPVLPLTVPRQLSIGFDSIRPHGVDPAERAKVLAALICLLIEAATADGEQSSDDER